MTDPASREGAALLTPRRVLFVSDSLEVGGAERALLRLADVLIGAGHAVEIAASVGGALRPEAVALEAPVHILEAGHVKRRESHRFASKLEAILADRHFELVHSHMHASTFAASIAAERCTTPLVVTEHSEGGWRDHRARVMARVALGRSQRVIAVSEAIRRRLVRVDQVNPCKVEVIHNALDAAPPSALRTWPETVGPIIGVVARLQPEKGVSTFVEAAALLAKRVPGARFVVVGDGPLRDELSDRIAALNLSPVFKLLGFRPDAAAVIGGLDVLAVPSLTEGTPLTVLEAMAAGTPLVATRVGGIPDQVRHGCEALLVEPGDAAGLAQAIAALLSDPPLATRLSDVARHRLRERFRPEVMLSRVLACYGAALAGRDAPLGDGRESLTAP